MTTSLAALALAASACGEGESLPTTLDVAATDADIAAVDAAFDVPQVDSYEGLGYLMDEALATAGGAVIRLPMEMLKEGADRPLARHSARMMQLADEGTSAAIPLSALGKTFEWNVTTDQYEPTARTGAPANGVRFILYTLDISAFAPAEPLVEVGYADFTRSSNTATVGVYATGGTQLVSYTATVGGTTNAPTMAVEGFVGTGANRVNFELTFGVSLFSGNVTVSWRIEVPSRGLASRVQIGIGSNGVAFSALMRAGARKVEMGGTLGENGGIIVVRIGGKVFARLTFDAEGGSTVADADGNPLTPEQAETLDRIFEFFEGAFDAPDVLLSPLYTLLDVDTGSA
ncbi:MAG: hypothetical protein KF709_11195 [Gemmatimonadaceae bacterium]|nr:hypothetical protein [Gemmatimonadaceae bacterium]